MALKAGRVGLDPKYVTEEGAPISNSAEMESEIQQIKLDIADLQTSKVGITQLTANDKEFYFAYDATSQKYGYKLDGTGDFIPFEEGGIGWVPPKNLVHDDITLKTSMSYVSGGYCVKNGKVYLDIVINQTASLSSLTNANLCVLPSAILPANNVGLLYERPAGDISYYDAVGAKYAQVFGAAASSSTKGVITCNVNVSTGSIAAGKYHVWGQWTIAA